MALQALWLLYLGEQDMEYLLGVGTKTLRPVIDSARNSPDDSDY